MTRGEFYDKVAAIGKQLEDLINELPTVPELDDDDTVDYDESKDCYAQIISFMEYDLDYLSDLYFDDGAERIAARLK